MSQSFIALWKIGCLYQSYFDPSTPCVTFLERHGTLLLVQTHEVERHRWVDRYDSYFFRIHGDFNAYHSDWSRLSHPWDLRVYEMTLFSSIFYESQCHYSRQGAISTIVFTLFNVPNQVVNLVLRDPDIYVGLDHRSISFDLCNTVLWRSIHTFAARSITRKLDSKL